MTLAMKMAYGGVGVASIAVVSQSFTPQWVFLTLIIVQICCFTGPAMYLVKRDQKRAELLRKMEAAFGVNPNRVQ